MRVLIAELKQETATFNPCPTRYEDFHIHTGSKILDHFDGTRTELAGACDIFREAGVEVVPVMTAAAVSGGPILDRDLNRLLDELVAGVRDHQDVDGAYLCLHGAMAGETEFDPEGRLLESCRAILGEKPLVASLDLHAILTENMIRSADLLVPYHTYPHVDHYETGCRAANNLLRLLRKEIRPTTVRIALPMLVRGDELITASGKFGEAIRACQQIEESPTGLAAGVIIGNAFTDVPDLQSNVLVTTDNDEEGARAEAEKIARLMWGYREFFQAELVPLEQAIQMAQSSEGLTVFSDAADATASGASGDSNVILKGLLDHNFTRKSLVPIVDAPAV
ncbi:MAG: M81 family metallopeptidase, partial [Planctomycetaceae bacterium]|nr:M81 family metallopeptidase [Planctomycetaceae bacterium]